MACGPCASEGFNPTWLRGTVVAVSGGSYEVRLLGHKSTIPVSLKAASLSAVVGDVLLIVAIAPNQHMALAKIVRV